MKRYLFGAVAAAALSLTLGMSAEAKTLAYCSEGSPENFNPQINTTGTSLNAAWNIFDRLVDFTPGTTQIQPGLAEKWDISDDGLEYTFHLRKGVKFHSNKNFTPTRELNADDVIATFNRMWKAEDPYAKVSGGAYDYFNDMGMPDLLDSITKVDDYTVKFKLKSRDVTFLSNMAMDFAAIHSKEYMDAMLKAGTPEEVDQTPIGSGPFQFVAYQKDTAIRYKAFPEFWGGKQKIDDLVFVIAKEPAVRKAKLEAGECDIMAYPAAADVAALQANQKLNVLQQNGLNAAYLYINVTKPPFDNVKVRKALNMAIDRDAIIKSIYQGLGTKAKNAIPPTIWAWDKSTPEYKYDPEGAKKLLEEAGVKDLTVDLWGMPVSRPYNPDGKRMAELMQADLAKVGIKANIVTYEWGEYRKRAQNAEGTLVQLGWTGDNGDPDNFFGILFHCRAAREGGQNISKWCNPEFSKVLDEAKATPDMAKRVALYHKAQQIFYNDAPVVTIAHSITSWPTSKKVTGFKVHPLGTTIFRDVDKTE